MNIPDLLAHGLSRVPHGTCVVHGTRSLSFSELDERVRRLTSAFRDHNLQPADRVVFLAQNDIEYWEMQIAAQRSQLIFVPLNSRLSEGELAAQVEDCRPQLLVYTTECMDIANKLNIPIKWQIGETTGAARYEDLIRLSSPTDKISSIECDRPCRIIYTSGTTGRGKGVVVSNGAFWARINLACVEMGIRPDDRLLFPLPLFHVSSSIAAAFIYRACSVVQTPWSNAAGVMESLLSSQSTHAVLVPTTLRRLTEYIQHAPASERSLRMVIYGGSPIDPDLLRRAIAVLGCDFMQVYGLTEAVNASILRPHDHQGSHDPEHLISAGTDAISYVVDVVTSQGISAASGEVGEVVIQGPGLMSGYWNATRETEEALYNGWLRTGDLGYRAPDGFLYITDRLKDMVVTGGENVYPREVESVLGSHPDVVEAAVIGVPDAEWGEAVHAVVVLRAGSHLTCDDLVAHCRTHLASFKIPKTFEIVERLPKTANGKIAKGTLREHHWSGSKRAVG